MSPHPRPRQTPEPTVTASPLMKIPAGPGRSRASSSRRRAGASTYEQYLDPTVNIETLPLPLTWFPGPKQPLPERELTCAGWSAFIEEIAADPAPVVKRKENVRYYIAGTLQEAEFVGKTRESAINQKEYDRQTALECTYRDAGASSVA